MLASCKTVGSLSRSVGEDSMADLPFVLPAKECV